MNPRWISLPANATRNLSNLLLSTLPLLVCCQLRATDLPGARNFLETYCVSCHGGEKPKGDFDARPLATSASLKEHLPRWLDVLDQVASAQMPPKKNRKTTPELNLEITSPTTTPTTSAGSQALSNSLSRFSSFR